MKPWKSCCKCQIYSRELGPVEGVNEGVGMKWDLSSFQPKQFCDCFWKGCTIIKHPYGCIFGKSSFKASPYLGMRAEIQFSGCCRIGVSITWGVLLTDVPHELHEAEADALLVLFLFHLDTSPLGFPILPFLIEQVPQLQTHTGQFGILISPPKNIKQMSWAQKLHFFFSSWWHDLDRNMNLNQWIHCWFWVKIDFSKIPDSSPLK